MKIYQVKDHEVFAESQEHAEQIYKLSQEK
jgi:hypothetical protein